MKYKRFSSAHLASLLDNTDQKPTNNEPTVSTGDPETLVQQPLEPNGLNDLVSPEPHYALGLRIILLRTLLNTTAANQLTSSVEFGTNRVMTYLGFTNYERYAKGRTFAELRTDLSEILATWEQAHADANWFPVQLRTNLDRLASAVNLNETEKTVLGFVVLLHAESLLEYGTDLIGSNLSGYSVHNPLAKILSLPEAAVEAALSQTGRLASSGLLTLERHVRYNLKELLDLLTHTFHTRMVGKLHDIRDLVGEFVRPAQQSSLRLSDFKHVDRFVSVIRAYLHTALDTGKNSANILLYGLPGTGKTQFARVLAQSLDVQLLEVSPTSKDGSAISPMRRIRNFCVAQSFYGVNRCVLLFDEVEEILSSSGFNRSFDESSTFLKSFLNHLLDHTQVPTIWIANSIEAFDAAYLRRFDICLEMPVPSTKTRLEMLNAAFKGKAPVSTKLLETIAKHDAISPALIHQLAQISSMFSHKVTDTPSTQAVSNQTANQDAYIVDILNEKLRAQHATLLHYPANARLLRLVFDPLVINCTVDLAAIEQGLRESRTGRLCIYGPPGTGKTAFGKWLADRLDMPHTVLSASDLMSKYLGETEQKIARAFATAQRHGSILQFDEVDTFLQDRQHAQHHYEISQVNEMLLQLENFEGIFIASTNLMNHLDQASLRRFDMVIAFGFLTPAAAMTLFMQACNMLGMTASSAGLGQVKTMRGLTPGDFEVVLRRASLVRLPDETALLAALAETVRLKKAAIHSPIGFLEAA